MPLFNKKIKDKKTESPVKDKKKSAKPASMKELYTSDAKKPKAVGADSPDAKKTLPVLAGKILIKPLITEKGSDMSASGKYFFAVANNANKISVEKAVYEAYGIRPVKVNIMNVLGKIKRHGRVTGKRKDWKKAIVTLPKGKTIQVYEGI